MGPNLDPSDDMFEAYDEDVVPEDDGHYDLMEELDADNPLLED